MPRWDHWDEEEIEDHEPSDRSTQRRDHHQRSCSGQRTSWTPTCGEGERHSQGKQYIFL